MDKLTDYIRVYENALDLSKCEQYLNLFEEKKENVSLNGKDRHEPLPNSSWLELNLNESLQGDEFKGLISKLHYYKGVYEQDCGIKVPLRMPDGLAPLTMKRYQANSDDSFEVHYDSVGNTCTRYLVFLFYLNDVEDGGETVFVDLDVKVAPKAGSLLIFPPYWNYRHAAMPAISNDKYILSTYYLWWK